MYVSFEIAALFPLLHRRVKKSSNFQTNILIDSIESFLDYLSSRNKFFLAIFANFCILGGIISCQNRMYHLVVAKDDLTNFCCCLLYFVRIFRPRPNVCRDFCLEFEFAPWRPFDFGVAVKNKGKTLWNAVPVLHVFAPSMRYKKYLTC